MGDRRHPFGRSRRRRCRRDREIELAETDAHHCRFTSPLWVNIPHHNDQATLVSTTTNQPGAQTISWPSLTRKSGSSGKTWCGCPASKLAIDGPTKLRQSRSQREFTDAIQGGCNDRSGFAGPIRIASRNLDEDDTMTRLTPTRSVGCRCWHHALQPHCWLRRRQERRGRNLGESTYVGQHVNQVRQWSGSCLLASNLEHGFRQLQS